MAKYLRIAVNCALRVKLLFSLSYLVDQVSGGSGLTGVHMSNDDQVDVFLFLSHLKFDERIQELRGMKNSSSEAASQVE